MKHLDRILSDLLLLTVILALPVAVLVWPWVME